MKRKMEKLSVLYKKKIKYEPNKSSLKQMGSLLKVFRLYKYKLCGQFKEKHLRRILNKIYNFISPAVYIT